MITFGPLISRFSFNPDSICYIIFSSPNSLSSSHNKLDNWIIRLSGFLFIVFIYSYSLPSSLEPRTTYIRYSLILILILQIFFWVLMKKCRNSEPLVTSEERPENRMNSTETIGHTYERHQTKGTQISLTTSESSLPPKYERSPSYSQALIVREWIDRKVSLV